MVARITRKVVRKAAKAPTRTKANTFCSCIKSVQKSMKLKKEGRAIAICVKSVLQRRGRTLKKFKCRGKPQLQTQPLK